MRMVSCDGRSHAEMRDFERLLLSMKGLAAVVFAAAVLAFSPALGSGDCALTEFGPIGCVGERIVGFTTIAAAAGCGDVDGDGADELLLCGVAAGVSRAVIVWGTSNAYLGVDGVMDLDSSTTGTAFRLEAPTDSSWLRSVSGAGDVNGDGFQDFLIGVPYDAPEGVEGAGQVFLVFGGGGRYGLRSSAATTEIGSTVPGVRILGPSANARAGMSVAAAGDVNGDGFDDVLIGAPGIASGSSDTPGDAYLLYGAATWGDNILRLGSLAPGAGAVLRGGRNGSETGLAVAGAGDMNGDGFDDIAVGAWKSDPSPFGFSGRFYLVLGRPEGPGVGGQLNLDSIPPEQGVSLAGVDEQGLGKRLAGAGDLNGDGLDDLILIGDLTGGCGVFASASILLGGDWTAQGWLPATVGHLPGESCPVLRDLFGHVRLEMNSYQVAAVGDHNANGFADFLIGVPGFARPGSGGITGYGSEGLYFWGSGYARLFPGHADLTPPWAVAGGTSFDIMKSSSQIGKCVAGGCDLNGDGLPEAVFTYSPMGEDIAFVFYETAPSVEGTWRMRSAPGDAPPKSPGRGPNAASRFSPSRCRIDFADGGGPEVGNASREAVTRTRLASTAGLLLPPGVQAAPTLWTIQSNRTDWTSATLHLRIEKQDLLSLDPASLTILQAREGEDVFLPIPATFDVVLREATAPITSLGRFLVACNLPAWTPTPLPTESPTPTSTPTPLPELTPAASCTPWLCYPDIHVGPSSISADVGTTISVSMRFCPCLDPSLCGHPVDDIDSQVFHDPSYLFSLDGFASTDELSLPYYEFTSAKYSFVGLKPGNTTIRFVYEDPYTQREHLVAVHLDGPTPTPTATPSPAPSPTPGARGFLLSSPPHESGWNWRGARNP